MRKIAIILCFFTIAGNLFADWAEPYRLGEGPCVSVFPVTADSALAFWGEESLYVTTYSEGIWSDPSFIIENTCFRMFTRAAPVLDSRGRLWVFAISGAGSNYIIDDPETFAVRYGPDLFPMFCPDTSGNLYYLQCDGYGIHEFGKSMGDTIWSREYLFLPGFPDYYYDCLLFESDSNGLNFIWSVKDYDDHSVDTVFIVYSHFRYDSPESTWDYFDTLTYFYEKIPFDAVRVIDGWIIALVDEYRFTTDSIDAQYYCCHLSGATAQIETLDSGSFWTYTSTWAYIKLAVNNGGTEVSCVWKSPYIHIMDSLDMMRTYSNIDYAHWDITTGWSTPLSLTSSNKVRHLGYEWKKDNPIIIDQEGNTWVCWYEWIPESGSFCYLTHENPTGVRETNHNMAREYGMLVSPNPFNSACRISVDCHSREGGNPEGGVPVEIYDIAGRMVAELPVGDACMRPAGGIHPAPTVFWRPDESVGSGIYLVRLNGADSAKKIIYMK